MSQEDSPCGLLTRMNIGFPPSGQDGITPSPRFRFSNTLPANQVEASDLTRGEVSEDLGVPFWVGRQGFGVKEPGAEVRVVAGGALVKVFSVPGQKRREGGGVG